MLRGAWILLLTLSVAAAALAAEGIPPGFTLEKVADAEGFITALEPAPDGTLTYSTRTGEIFRLDGTRSELLGRFDTASLGNEALLGFAWRTPTTIVAHYVDPDHTADLIGELDVETGEVRELARLECDSGRPCPSEHHGGNLIIDPAGNIYVGIGDYGGGLPAQRDGSPGGKLWVLSADGVLEEFARGLRNPFDLAWLEEGLLLVSDNGPVGDDEMNLIRKGDNGGWPWTVGNKDPVPGTIAPVYVFPDTTAPTGMRLVSGVFRGGALVTTFVTRSVVFFPPPFTVPMRSPVVLLSGPQPLIDVTEADDGTIWVAGTSSIFRLEPPRRGDANGDGALNDLDAEAIALEILDGDGDDIHDVHGGSILTGWGSDANGDGLVDARDLVELGRLRQSKVRPVRHPRQD